MRDAWQRVSVYVCDAVCSIRTQTASIASRSRMVRGVPATPSRLIGLHESCGPPTMMSSAMYLCIDSLLTKSTLISTVAVNCSRHEVNRAKGTQQHEDMMSAES
jgi:hypothetical protein